METYHGHVRTPHDAIILFEACRLGLLPRVQRRLSEKERQSIRSGSVFVWDEREAGMRRWTDGKSWSASRVAGSFLNYREMEGKRGGNPSYNSPSHQRGSPEDADTMADAPADGYRYKPDGLIKQSFSITTNQGQHLHLISYYARSDPNAPMLLQPSTDPNLRHIHPAKGMYPDASIHDSASLPPVTRSPMTASFSGSPQPQYAYAHRPAVSPGYGWPPSPLHTPPTGQYSHHPGPQTPYQNGPAPGYFPGPPSYAAQPRQAAMPTAFDRAPGALPPPPHMGPAYSHSAGLPPPHHPSQYPMRPYDAPAGPASAPLPSAYPPVTTRAPSASTIPSINSLINRSPEPVHVSPYHHPAGGPPRPSPPGGERQTLGTEKSGFREDLRALRQLDRNFT